ncbi:hypothetical protein BOTBODRAFT_34740 [Botryobasidium botryosum FD-172 SS1]|uniref:Uncharacterized protein n=1 Tax=Botryobasidium botryosum (strain FD-172 SS1) TaxID=930990 RepID=A0A067M8L3_BOTB1|nr:hypothetical protein BOTBODRAFT_34740 [Botryobasidium botryosum FD-172 SS1]
MIIDKPEILDTPPVQPDAEAPPSYDLVTAPSSSRPQPPRSTGVAPSPVSPRQTAPVSPVGFAGPSLPAPQGSAGPSKQRRGWLGSYFSGTFKTDQEIRSTVLNLV